MTINLLATNTVLSWSAVPFAAGYRISHNGIVIEEQIKSTTFNYKLYQMEHIPLQLKL